MKRLFVSLGVAILVWTFVSPSWAKPLETATVQNSARVLQESISIPSGIPLGLMNNAQAIAIIPDVLKLGFVVGGRRGHGVMVVRSQDGSWTNPVFITLTGGSIGYQIGVQATDVILVFRSRKSIDAVLKGEFTLGADAAVAAGPVGRQAAAGTDIQLKAEIYSYSRSRGLFAGVSLDGSVIQIDANSNGAYYASIGITPYDILANRVARAPAEVAFLKDLLAQGAPGAPSATGWVDPAAAPILTPGPSPVASPTPSPVASPMPSPVASPMPAPVASPVPGPVAAPTSGAANLETTRQQLIASAGRLHARVDESWRKYLSLPPGVATPDRPPSVEAMAETLKRYDVVSHQPQYRSLTQTPDFQATHELLRAYLNALSSIASQQPAASPLPGPSAPAAR